MATFVIVCLVLSLVLTLQTVANSMESAKNASNARTKGAAQRRIIDGIGRCIGYILQIFKAVK